MKRSFSPKATDLLLQLLERDPELRLGYGPSDAELIKRHPFFEDVDWEAMETRSAKPPFIPKTKAITDIKYIDPMFTDEPPTDTPMEDSKMSDLEKRAAHFDEFTYTKDSAVKIASDDLPPEAIEEAEKSDLEEDASYL